jgi:hypothetical protein
MIKPGKNIYLSQISFAWGKIYRFQLLGLQNWHQIFVYCRTTCDRIYEAASHFFKSNNQTWEMFLCIFMVRILKSIFLFRKEQGIKIAQFPIHVIRNSWSSFTEQNDKTWSFSLPQNIFCLLMTFEDSKL